MSTRRKGLCVCLVVLVGLVFFSGCGGNSQRVIVGKWRGTDIGFYGPQSQTWEFFKDGRFTFSVSNKYTTIKDTGRYEFIEKDKLRFNWDDGASNVRKFEISKNRLFLTSSSGFGEFCERFQRVK